MERKERSLPINKEQVDHLYNVDNQNPLMNLAQSQKFEQIKHVLANELRYNKELKIYSGSEGVNRGKGDILKNPVRATYKDLKGFNDLHYKCILTGERINDEDEFIVFIMKRQPEIYIVAAVIKNINYFPLLMHCGSFVEAFEMVKTKPPGFSDEEKKEIQELELKYKLLVDRKYCYLCGTLLNTECTTLIQLASKKRCDHCIARKVELPAGFRFCRNCGKLFHSSESSFHCISCNK
ncbi:MAG: zinc ribbon domain-containing protein [Candidatus Paceibacterota bacterium]